MRGREYVGGTLDNGFPGLWHCDGSAPRYEDRLISRAEGQHPGKTALDQNDLKKKE